MLDLLFSNPFAFIVLFGGIIISIGIHEFAHCFMADKLGDPTPRSMGRLTLNPLAHLDPLGTLAIVVTGFFGWGKPAPFDPYNLTHPKRDTALIALAGPVSNLILASLGTLIFRLVPAPPLVGAVLISFVALNVNLAIFNLLPIPPLDGSKVITRFNALIGQNYTLILLAIILPIFDGRSLVSWLITPITSFILHLLLG